MDFNAPEGTRVHAIRGSVAMNALATAYGFQQTHRAGFYRKLCLRGTGQLEDCARVGSDRPQDMSGTDRPSQEHEYRCWNRGSVKTEHLLRLRPRLPGTPASVAD